MNPHNLIEFIKIAGKLKSIPRTGWVESGIESPESVADHSYRTALLSMVLSDHFGLNTERVMRMALLHDLAESTMGDLTPRQKKPDHHELETNAIQGILEELPEKLKRSYIETWDEYQKNKTLEAKLVHNADKLEMLIQASEYENKDIALDQFWETQIDSEYERYKPKRG